MTQFKFENKKVYKRYKNEILSGIKKCNKDFIESLWKNYSFSFNVDKKLKKIKFDKPVLFMAGRQDICVGYKDLSSNFIIFLGTSLFA